jgi:hypothetical protein
MAMFNGKINYKWQFSIAMLNYQRVNPLRPLAAVLQVVDSPLVELRLWVGLVHL